MNDSSDISGVLTLIPANQLIKILWKSVVISCYYYVLLRIVSSLLLISNLVIMYNNDVVIGFYYYVFLRIIVLRVASWAKRQRVKSGQRPIAALAPRDYRWEIHCVLPCWIDHIRLGHSGAQGNESLQCWLTTATDSQACNFKAWFKLVPLRNQQGFSESALCFVSLGDFSEVQNSITQASLTWFMAYFESSESLGLLL